MHAGRTEPAGLAEQVAEGVARLEERTGRALGDPDDPLLVSVRSGARDSMPGMLESILDLGLNDESVLGLGRARGRRALRVGLLPALRADVRQRRARHPGRALRGDPAPRPGNAPACARTASSRVDDVREDSRAASARSTRPTPASRSRRIRRSSCGSPIRAVFDSWLGDRAVVLPPHQPHPGRLGHGGQRPADGVRQPRRRLGDRRRVLARRADRRARAQRRLPARRAGRGRRLRRAHAAPAARAGRASCRRPTPSCCEILRTLEAHYGDMQDVEFTVERGRLYMLQTRGAKRPAQAAIRFAVDAVDEGLLTREQALRHDRRRRARRAAAPDLRPGGALRGARARRRRLAGRGQGRGRLHRRGGGRRGRAGARRHPRAPVHRGRRRRRLPRRARDPHLRGRQGLARGARRPRHGPPRGRRRRRAGDRSARAHRSASATWSIAAGQRIAIDGGTGMVTLDDVPLVEPARSERFERVLRWADEIRRLGVRANADTPADALKALEHGAEGIGLCRTEHMFMAADRQPKMRAMIMARTEPERRAALAELLPLQQQDFEGLFAAMPGKPITIRLLDPPLHEFLPDRVELAQRVQRARDERAPELAALEQELELVLRLGEVNPMLGTRGCRLGIVHPEIYEMQVEAIMLAARAAADAAAAGDHDPARRLRGRAGRDARAGRPRRRAPRAARGRGLPRRHDDRAAARVLRGRPAGAARRRSSPSAPTTSRRPRSASRATTSRPASSRPTSSAGSSTARRSRRSTSPASARSSRWPCALGRERREGIELGVCGEHGGDPDSIAFFHRAGLDYVSCSPYRLPIARVAAAQAALAGR